MGAAQKRILSRAVRVLNEIESRLHELREELEEQTGGQSGSRSSRSRSSKSSDSEEGEEGEEDEAEAGGQGQVKHPETDRRLKQNRDD